MKYYSIVKNWKKIKKHINNKDVNHILVKDFNKYTYGRWRQKFKKGMFPRNFESCDWDWQIKGRKPEYWLWVKHSACHWLVNFNLKLANLVEPKKQWRIVTSDKHSTVWDGNDILFDFNFCALKIDPNEAFKLANEECLRIGELLKVHFAKHYTKDLKRNRK